MQHRAGVRPFTSFYNFAESCVFNKQSLPSILFHLYLISHNMTLLLPKLQSYFAEFLQYYFLNTPAYLIFIYQFRFLVRFFFWSFFSNKVLYIMKNDYIKYISLLSLFFNNRIFSLLFTHQFNFSIIILEADLSLKYYLLID